MKNLLDQSEVFFVRLIGTSVLLGLSCLVAINLYLHVPYFVSFYQQVQRHQLKCDKSTTDTDQGTHSGDGRSRG